MRPPSRSIRIGDLPPSRRLNVAGYVLAGLAAACALLVLSMERRHLSRPAVLPPLATAPTAPTVASVTPMTGFFAAPSDGVRYSLKPMGRPVGPAEISATEFERSREILAMITGLWTDGTMSLTIDASRPYASLATVANKIIQQGPVVVRDWTGPMMVVDIGRDRFILLTRSDGLAISGATLATPIELRRPREAAAAPRKAAAGKR